MSQHCLFNCKKVRLTSRTFGLNGQPTGTIVNLVRLGGKFTTGQRRRLGEGMRAFWMWGFCHFSLSHGRSATLILVVPDTRSYFYIHLLLQTRTTERSRLCVFDFIWHKFNFVPCVRTHFAFTHTNGNCDLHYSRKAFWTHPHLFWLLLRRL